MTREEAIERMKTMRWEHATNPCPDRTAFDMAISALENKGEWIPVSERLPENNDDVLVYDSEIFVAWYSGIEGNWCSADNRFDEYTPILAWQPLPEPYKAEKHETCKGCLEPCIMYEPDMRSCKHKVTEKGGE